MFSLNSPVRGLGVDHRNVLFQNFWSSEHLFNKICLKSQDLSFNTNQIGLTLKLGKKKEYSLLNIPFYLSIFFLQILEAKMLLLKISIWIDNHLGDTLRY